LGVADGTSSKRVFAVRGDGVVAERIRAVFSWETGSISAVSRIRIGVEWTYEHKGTRSRGIEARPKVALWAEEAQRRDEEMDAHPDSSASAKDVLREARAKLK
jgi:secreted PhoX family phosphatase